MHGKRLRLHHGASQMNATTRRDTLEALLRCVARGDERAFRRLYELTSPRFYALARRLMWRDDLAEEMLQDAYLRIWSHAADYDPHIAHPLAWMAKIVR